MTGRCLPLCMAELGKGPVGNSHLPYTAVYSSKPKLLKELMKLKHCCLLILFLTAGTTCFANPEISNKKSPPTSNAKSVSSWEIRTAPLAFLARWLTLDLSYRPTNHWAFGPSFISYQASRPGGFLAPSYRGLATGFNLNYYFDSVHTETWYLSSHVYYENFESYPHAYSGYIKRSGYKANSAIGYQGKWSQVSVLTGVGIEYLSHSREDINDTVNPQTSTFSNENRSRAFFEFKMGYSF